MSFLSTLQSWMDKIIGHSEELPLANDRQSFTEDLSEITTSQPVKSDVKATPGPSRSSKLMSDAKCNTSIKLPSVMRSSVIDNEDFRVIPPIPRLYLREDTVDKLSRILAKLDSWDPVDDVNPVTVKPTRVKSKND